MGKTILRIFSMALILVGGLSIPEALSQRRPQYPVTHYTLKNGLQVILAEDYSFPIVSVVVTYRVGSMDEVPGKTGLSYLMENLMFQGSANVSPMQHFHYINRIGGELNASTSEDRTVFQQTVPSNQLALVLWLESDRMRFLEIDEMKVDQIKNMLLEDLRQRRDNNPYLESFFLFDQFFFSDFAHGHPFLGNTVDIRNLTVEDVRNFYSSFYVPNNTVLCIVGNFNKVKANELVAKYFETIPKGKEVTFATEPFAPAKKALQKDMENSLTPSPAFHLGFRIAPPQSSDFYTVTILDYLLLRGQTSRLPKRLYKKEKIAIQLSGGIEKRRDRALYRIFATCNNQFMVNQCQEAIFSELEKLKTTFISETELTKAKNMFKQDHLRKLSTTLDKALYLTEIFLTHENVEDPQRELDEYLAVTPTDVVAIANRYFLQKNSVILNVKIK
ncbi:MAG: pitrilysin family protein [Candidatus Aminicenantales bacterium]